MSKIIQLLLVVSIFASVFAIAAENRKHNQEPPKPLSGLMKPLASPPTSTTSATQSCQGIDGETISCPSDQECCGSGCIEISCMNASVAQCCTWWIGATQCSLTQSCCGMMGTGASSAAFCCGEGSSCCETFEDGMSQCCSQDEICCKGENSFCCPTGSTCNNNAESCCLPGTTLCGEFCCDDASEVCENNACQWVTPYPTYSPSAHYKPYELIWHVNGSEYDYPTTIDLKSSKTNDFIVYGDFTKPYISRFDGIDGSAKWTIKLDLANYLGGQMLVQPVVNEAAGIIFNLGIGIDLSSGALVYNTTAQFNAACPLSVSSGMNPQFAFQTATVMTFYCWDEQQPVAYVFASIAAKTGAVVGQYAPKSNHEAASVSPTAAATARSNIILYQLPNSQNFAITGIDALTSKEIFQLDTAGIIPFNLEGSTPNIVNPVYDGNGYYMTASSMISQINDASNIFMIQQVPNIWGVDAHSGKLLWSNANCGSADSVFPFAIPTSGVVSATSTHKFVKSLGSSSKNVVAWMNSNGYVDIRDQQTGSLLWQSPKPMTTVNTGRGEIMFGASKHLLFGLSATSVFAIDTSISSATGNATFSLRWETSAIANLPSANALTSLDSPYLFVHNGNTLLILSPADGSILHSWPLLPASAIKSVFVSQDQKTVRVTTENGVRLYQL